MNMSNVRVRDTEGAHGPDQGIRRPRCGSAAERRDDAHGHSARMSDTEGEAVMDNQEVLFAEPHVDTVPPANGSTAVATREETSIAASSPTSEAGSILGMVERMMVDPNVSIERANQAWDFAMKIRAEQSRKSFDQAVAEAKAQIKPVARNAKGNNDKKYADFAAIAREIDPILGPLGLSYRFRSSQNDGRISVTCRLGHKDGHFEETTLVGPADNTGNKNAIQAIGSTLTYLQRYSLVLMLGLAASNDDDGRRAELKDGEPDPLATITEEQQAEIKQLLEDTNSDLGKFLEFAKAEFVGDILAKDFATLKAILLKKKSETKSKGNAQ